MIKDDEVPKHRSKKDKRRWCGGKPGREHDPMWEHSKKTGGSPNSVCWLDYVCQRCHKCLDAFWRFEAWLQPLSHHHTYEQPEVGSREPLKKREKDE
jgi:hypothetical protein